jgi:drug/metabolite transporter (DMT)-like permease
VIAVAAVSLVAAFLFGLAAALQQHAAREYRDRSALSLIRRLLRRRIWIFGQLTNLSGFMAQAAALSLGSVGVVQPLITTELVFAVVAGDVADRRPPRKATIAGAAAVCGGLALFLSIKGAAPSDGNPDRHRLLFLAPIVAGAVLLAVAASRKLPPLTSALVLGVAAGTLFACSAVLIKLTTHDLFHRGVAATATDWPGYTLAVSTAGGLLLEQLAFASGPLAPGMTAMTVTNPVVSYVFAGFAFHAPVPDTPGALAAVAGAALLVAAGVVLVSRSASRAHARRREGQIAHSRLSEAGNVSQSKWHTASS